MVTFYRDDVVSACGLLQRGPSVLFELRILTPKGTYSGYFDDVEKLAREAEYWNAQGNLYVTLNELHPDCAARRLNRVEWSRSGELTKDAEIVRRLIVYIDLDPRRLSGIPSTDEEHAAAAQMARSVRSFLREQRLPEVALMSSGNGYALLLAVDLPADDSGLVKRFLEALATKFDNAAVSVDCSVHNASRIARLAGTLNCKGENLPHRPHRVARLIEAPDKLVPATTEQLLTVIAAISGTESASTPAVVSPPAGLIDVSGWLTSLGVAHTARSKDEGTQFQLMACPFKPLGHDAGGAAIFQFPDGRITASCFHSNCHWGWEDLRHLLDPKFDDRAEEVALPGREGLKDPHRLARIVINEFYHPDHNTLILCRDCFYAWQDGVWEELTRADIRRVITRCVKKEFDRYALEMRKQGAKGQPAQVTTSLVGDVQNALASLIDVTMSIRAGWLSGDGWPIDEILVCKSSIVHLPSYLEGRLDYVLPHTPRLFSTNKLQFDFDPFAPPPVRWLQFLDEVWPSDTGSQRQLQEFFGYCLTPDVSQQKFLMLVGASRGGKGVTTRLLIELVGKPNFCAVRLGKISSQFGLENVVGKSLILVPDANMPSAYKAAEIAELVKAVIGCDPLDINRKGRPIITAVLPAKIVVSTNKMIALPDESAALYNRMLVLRFTKSFYGREDTKLDETLGQELPSVLLWAIEGYRRLRANNQFNEAPSGLLLKRQLRVAGASVASFVEDCCDVDPKHRIEKAALFTAYQRYCNEIQVQPCDLPQFSTQLMEAVASVDSMRPTSRDQNGKRPRYYAGIDLKAEQPVESFETENNADWPVDIKLSTRPIVDRNISSAIVPTIAV